MAGTNATTATSATTSNALRRALVGANPRRTLARVALIVGMAYVIFGLLLIPVRGHGPSMWPTLNDGQFVLINRLAYLGAQPKRGDVVALRVAGGRAVYIKRIIGLPGEHVRIEQGVVIVNEARLAEPYVQQRRPWDVGEVRLTDDEYLMIGDNRGMPQSSHDFGKARRERVLGRIVSW